MFNNKFVVYGTGLASKEVIRNTDKNKCIAILTPESVSDNAVFEGIQLKNDEILNNIDYPFEIIIASQYFNLIYERLKKENKLDNKNIVGIYVPNLLGHKPIYDEENTIPLNDEDYNWLFENISDKASINLLTKIKEERCSDDYPSNKYVEYSKGFYYSGNEDYWDSIRPAIIQNYKNIVIDVGAYTGDSIDRIVSNIGVKIDKYFAFEPMENNYNKLIKSKVKNIEQFIPMKIGLGRKCGNLLISYDDQIPYTCSTDSSVKGRKKTEEIKVVTLDSLNFVEKANYYIKMDIEGSEMSVIQGGENFIKEMKPNLAVCLYHKTRDLIEIPKYLKELVKDYQFYIVGGCHTILIAKNNGVE